MGKTGSTLVAILAGAAVGAVAGVLLAPEQGEQTRKKISKGFKSGADDLNCKMDDLKKQVKSLISTKKADFDSSFNSLLSKADDKKEDVIASLERKLAELKGEAANAVDKAKDFTNKAADNIKSELK
ncbi:YtxH domain-containing protein [Flavobacterium sp. xlx-214]|uniref:YtxH domain-containing protein n=1 Tax=unclassified Flavobacterium TaxID=196869 RepID=UPI0013D4ED50|nr:MULTISPECIES: YtxH domain-containing protein [unclassified Flavobacterium]MBA5792083.1 YtxH domain-containing protein [Flavobacterium sp. xlx-221]QMI84330.1 YtxH domain-containing protein [Flavobacterium sp. xlx-214]